MLDDRLYLIELTGSLIDGTEATVATFFPSNPERVFAHWFSGKLRLPRGKLLKYIHLEFDNVYEEDVFLDVDKGVVTHTEVRTNGMTLNPRAPVGSSTDAKHASLRDCQNKDNET